MAFGTKSSSLIIKGSCILKIEGRKIEGLLYHEMNIRLQSFWPWRYNISSPICNKPCWVYLYTSPSIWQPFILRQPLIIRLLGLAAKCHPVLNNIFKTTCNIRPHFPGPMGSLKIKGLLYEWTKISCLFQVIINSCTIYLYLNLDTCKKAKLLRIS